jgi:hypothetical protein
MKASLTFLAFLALSGASYSQDTKARGVAAWDSGTPAPDPIAPRALAGQKGWTALSAQGLVKGDAVLTNGRITAVARRAGTVDLYSAAGDLPVARGAFSLLGSGGEPAAKFDSLKVTEVGKGSVSLELAGRTAKGSTLSAVLRLKKNDPVVEVQPGDGAARLRLECLSRFAVLPDFFSDDIVIDASKIPAGIVDAPTENFLVQLTGSGDSMVMSVFENREQEVRLSVGKGSITASEIDFGKKGRLWVALLEGPSLWRTFDLARKDSGRVTPTGWKMPFRAMWRVDFTNTFDLFDSWDMALQDVEGGDFLRPVWFGEQNQRIRPNRQCFDAAIGGMLYPAFVDAKGEGFVQPFNEKGRMEISHRGPAVLYPVNRLPQTPLDAFTVVDIMRNTMGVGPCEHILDVEGQKQELKGRATCSVREELNSMYQAKEQKARRADAEQFLKQGDTFVRHIRGRIQGYVDFGHQMLDLLATRKKATPDIAAALAPLEKILGDIDASVAARKDKIRTPEYAQQLFEDFRKNLLDNDGADALEKVKQWTEALVEVGGNQDELVSHCRWVVKNVRQKAGLLMLQDPKAAPTALEVRTKAQEVLRNPSVHETMRH